MTTHDNHDERRDPECAECNAEMEASYREHIVGYRAERNYRESMALARDDLDMTDVPERELMAAIQLRLK